MRAWVGVAAVLVRVYDVVGVSEADRRVALEVAQDVLAAANVHIIFKNCRAGAQGCDTVPADGERIIRIIKSPVPQYSSTMTLGNAVVDSVTKSGVFATVFYDRVAARAAAEDVDHRLLLGRTIAHELGHLLLGVSTHSATGLMREYWTDEELRTNKVLDWKLSAQDRSKICMGLLRKRSLCADVSAESRAGGGASRPRPGPGGGVLKTPRTSRP